MPQQFTEKTLVPEHEDPGDEIFELPDALEARRILLSNDPDLERMLQNGMIVPIVRLSRDLRQAATVLRSDQVRWLVQEYYLQQEHRIRADAQIREAQKTGAPNNLLLWTRDNHALFEADMKLAMKAYAESRPEGRWLMSITGIGPVIAAGLMAHLGHDHDSPAHIWSFAGLNPEQKWLGTERARTLVNEMVPAGADVDYEMVCRVAERAHRNPQRLWKLVLLDRNRDAAPDASVWVDIDNAVVSDKKIKRTDLAATLAKRPWNAALKVLVWKAETSFVKSSGRPSSFYGPIYVERKVYEQTNNEKGAYADQAAQALSEKTYRESTEAYKWYSQGKLPPAHIQARAMRYAAKLFLSHYWKVCWSLYRPGVPMPEPYPVAHLGHSKTIEPPGWPM